KHFRGQSAEPGTQISYWLKGDASDVKVEISDVTGRVVRTIDGPKTAGLNRVRWTLQGNPVAGRGVGGGTGQAERAGAPARATRPPAANPPATAPAAGPQGAGSEDRPAAPAAQGAAQAPQQAGRGGRGGQQGAGAAQGGPPPGAPAGAQWGRGRGGFGGPTLP